MIFALYSLDKPAEDATVPPQGNGFPGFTLACLTGDEAKVDALLAQAEKPGARIVKSARKTFWGGYSGYFADPDGFLREIAYNPFWNLDKKGNVWL